MINTDGLTGDLFQDNAARLNADNNENTEKKLQSPETEEERYRAEVEKLIGRVYGEEQMGNHIKSSL